MHLTLDEMLAVRDGEGTAGHAEHLRACARCSGELAGLESVAGHLRSLPAVTPAHDPWPAVAAATREARTQRRLVRGGWIAAGLAASFTIAVAVRGAVEVYEEKALQSSQRQAVAESQRLEQVLAGGRGQGRVVSGRTACVISEIEDRIAAVDARLGQAKGQRPTREILDLWQERVRLLDALASVQSTRVAYVGL